MTKIALDQKEYGFLKNAVKKAKEKQNRNKNIDF